jgi:PAS domain S-box-containing protein
LPEGHNPIRRFLSVPVLERGKVRMILGVGNKTEPYTEQDVFQTEMVAHNLQNILARRHAEQQLREREERLSLTLKTTRDAIWDWNIPQGNGYASPSYYTMLGYDHDSISLNSDAWWSLIHPDDLKKVREAINLVMQSQFTSQDDVPASEFRMKTNTGGWRWILARGKVVEWDGEGHPVRMVGTHTDITERKQAEEALRQREAMLRSVFRATPVGLCIMKDRVFQSANKAWYDTFGYAETDIIGHTTRMLYENEEEYERVGRELVTGLSESGFVSVQTRLQRKDGVSRDATVIAAPLQPEDLSSGMVVTIEDITDRNRGEQELRESRRRLNDIIEFLPDATLVVDGEGIVLAWNRAMETMTGVKKENMLDRGDYEYALPFYGTRRPILIDLALRQDKELEKQYQGIQRWGDTVFGESRTPNLPPGDIYLSATATVLRDSSGNIIAAIECIRDITERMQLEAQIRQAQKMEAIGTLAGGIAHDFNNILASMVGYTELAMMNGDKADLQSGYLEQVMKACERAKNLVNQILLFSCQREQEKRSVDVRSDTDPPDRHESLHQRRLRHAGKWWGAGCFHFQPCRIRGDVCDQSGVEDRTVCSFDGQGRRPRDRSGPHRQDI